jgi:hypothetical protein
MLRLQMNEYSRPVLESVIDPIRFRMFLWWFVIGWMDGYMKASAMNARSLRSAGLVWLVWVSGSVTRKIFVSNMEQITNRNHQTIRSGLVLSHWLFSVTVVTSLLLSTPSPSFTTNRRFGEVCSYYNYNRHCIFYSMSTADGMEDEQKKRSFGSISDAAKGKLDDKKEKRDSLSLLSKSMTLPGLSTHPTTKGKGECSVPVVVPVSIAALARLCYSWSLTAI